MDFRWIDELPELEHYFYFGIYRKNKKLKTFITIPSRAFPDDSSVVDGIVQKTTPSNIKPIAKAFFAKYKLKEDKPKPKAKSSKSKKPKRQQFVLYVVVTKDGAYKLIQDDIENINKKTILKSESFYITPKDIDKKAKEFFKYYKENVYHNVDNSYGIFTVGDIVHHCDGNRTHTGVIVGVRHTAAMLVVCTTNEIWGRRPATKDELAFFAFKSRAQRRTLLVPAVRPYSELHIVDATFPMHRCEKLYKEMYGLQGEEK